MYGLVSHESVDVVAFTLWAAFDLRTPFAEIEIVAWLVRLPRNNRNHVDPVPNESLLGEFVVTPTL